MMASITKYKSIIIAAAIFLVFIWVYTLFFSGASTVATDQTAEAEGSDVLNLYASLQSVTLNPALFSSSLYEHLVDFSTVIPQQPVGRSNPFDIIGH